MGLRKDVLLRKASRKSASKEVEFKRRLKLKDETINNYVKIMDEYSQRIKRLENKIDVLEYQLSEK